MAHTISNDRAEAQCAGAVFVDGAVGTGVGLKPLKLGEEND